MKGSLLALVVPAAFAIQSEEDSTMLQISEHAQVVSASACVDLAATAKQFFPRAQGLGQIGGIGARIEEIGHTNGKGFTKKNQLKGFILQTLIDDMKNERDTGDAALVERFCSEAMQCYTADPAASPVHMFVSSSQQGKLIKAVCRPQKGQVRQAAKLSITFFCSQYCDADQDCGDVTPGSTHQDLIDQMRKKNEINVLTGLGVDDEAFCPKYCQKQDATDGATCVPKYGNLVAQVCDDSLQGLADIRALETLWCKGYCGEASNKPCDDDTSGLVPDRALCVDYCTPCTENAPNDCPVDRCKRLQGQNSVEQHCDDLKLIRYASFIAAVDLAQR